METNNSNNNENNNSNKLIFSFCWLLIQYIFILIIGSTLIYFVIVLHYKKYCELVDIKLNECINSYKCIN